MATSIHTRRVHIFARAATDLKNVALMGNNTPYLEISLEDSIVTTQVDEQAPQNPVWDQSFEVDIAGATPEDHPMVLRVTAKNKTMTPLVPDATIGTGSVPLTQLFGTGFEEVRVPLHDATGNPAGIAFIGVKMATPIDEQAIPSAAGTVLGEVARGPKGLAAEGTAAPMVVPTTEVSPTTPLVGAVVPGNIDDPSSPAYGILKD